MYIYIAAYVYKYSTLYLSKLRVCWGYPKPLKEKQREKDSLCFPFPILSDRINIIKETLFNQEE